ncbi:MAG: radical SAM protein, partial [Oscillospiraceae bacterium]|nr:radical SAM protein [Oscillospiraceae bacterium]
DFCTRLGVLTNLCPHFHISLQSGSDEILRRMGRHYDTARYLESTNRLRETFPDCAITTDLIVGFPGESIAEFDKSLAFMHTCGFADVHIFPYSARDGTKAAEMPGQIPKTERARRAKAAKAIADELRQNARSAEIGKTVSVLFETEAEGTSRGHTPNYYPVAVRGTGLKNQIHPIYIRQISDEILMGDLQ